MADSTINTPLEASTAPAVAGDHNAALQAQGHTEARPTVPAPGDKALPIPAIELVGAAPESQEAKLTKITDEATFRTAVQGLIKQAQAGQPVSFDVDTRVPMTGEGGKAIKGTQASILYDELSRAYPDKAYVFSKPDLKPGDAGYSEIPAPGVTNPEGVRLSSKENHITTGKDVVLADGTKLPAGSKFAVGTIYDGATVKSADPSGKVWAQAPDGAMVKVADAGQRASIESADLSADPKQMGQTASQGDHIIVRTAGGKGADGKPLVDPDGKPFLDAYPSNSDAFLQNYKPGSTADMWAAKAKSAEHLLLPGNVTVEAETAYGHATASGERQDYYMTSGFADAKDATAKNYTGETDVRSASELVRIRKEVGLTGETQVEAGLERSKAAVETANNADGGVWRPSDQFRSSAEGPAAGADAARSAALLQKAAPEVVAALNVRPEERSEVQKAAVDGYMKELGLSADQAREVETKASEGAAKGLPYLVVLGAVMGTAISQLHSGRAEAAGSDTYKNQ